MAVKVKNKASDNSKDTIVSYGKSEMVAVELTGQFGNGKVVAMHKIPAEKLVSKKLGKIRKDVDLDENKNLGRITQAIDEKVHGKAHKDS